MSRDNLETSKFIRGNDDIKIEVLDINIPKENIDDDNSKSVLKYISSNSANKHHKWSRSSEKTVNKYIQKALGYKTLYYETYFLYRRLYLIVSTLLFLVNCFE